ncbi:MAG TPA: EAL domain-containing protein [Phycisphaerales bacterium]|nr:EAL domain-containing protein [Phycisphaerales bacterium]
MTTGLPHRRVLIVDDNREIHADFRKILVPRAASDALDSLEATILGGAAPARPTESYEIESAYQGREAAEKVAGALASGRPFALAFIDMRMPPGWDGLETIERVWAIDPDLQVVICSAYSEHSRTDIVARTGRNHRLVILKKPFDTAEIEQLAFAMTEKWLASKQAALKMGELEELVRVRTSEIADANGRLHAKVSELEETRRALEVSERRYALAAKGANDGLWDWDIPADRVHYSARWCSIVGLGGEPMEAPPALWLDRVHPDDAPAVGAALREHLSGSSPLLEIEHRVRARDGGYRWVLCRGLAVRDHGGAAVRMAGSLSDISRRKETEDQLRQGAYFDRLTGLPNRALFRECLEQAIAESAGAGGGRLAVLFLDFDRFKVVNDSLGHLAGDQLLVEIAARLSACLASLRPGVQHSTLARLGGDEFVVLLRGPDAQAQAVRAADAIHGSFEAPMRIDAAEVHGAVSIGIAVDAGAYTTPDEMLRDADTAMYDAKARGGAGHSVFDGAMREAAVARLRLEAELRRAVQQGEITVAYQPIVDLQTSAVAGAEALARWDCPGAGPVSPERFIAIAEETGLVLQLGEQVLRTVCRDLRRLRAASPAWAGLRVNVNLSRRQFAQPLLVERVAEILREFDVPGEAIALEVTETIVMHDLEAAAATIRRLRALGIEVYMDDFGTGHSSLGCLKSLPLSGLKLDRSFVAHLTPGIATSAIIHAIVTLASNLNLRVVAEGIESRDQLAGMLALECDTAQGFFFGKPMSFEALTAWLASQTARRAAA